MELRQSFLKRNGSGITQDQFNSAIKLVTDSYQAIIAAHGATLNVSADWADDTINASADQSGSTWDLNFYGGLARVSAMTEDGMALVVCHEMSHHLGGFPFFAEPGSEWGAVEGQADYGAAHMCARHIWANDQKGNAKAAKTVDAYAKSKCDDAWTTAADRNICYRTANAGYVLAEVLAQAGGESTMPGFQTPDASAVDTTNEDHPAAQCRLDTYFRAALCTTAVDYSVIPGRNNPSGQQSADAQKEAFKYSCSSQNQPEAARPACWFKEI